MGRLETVTRNAEEIVTREELGELLSKKDRPRVYLGIEPSGIAHIGWIIVTSKVRDLLEADFEVIILLADWHAYLNDKFGGDLDKIQIAGEYIKDCFSAFGVETGKLKYIYASEMVNEKSYWEKVLRISKNSSLQRIKRALTIMGRKEDEADIDASKLIYPAMQVADIFHLDVDVAFGGMDQRKAHMLARDISTKLGWRKVIALHTPLLSGLQGGDRMEIIDTKMSKSNPEASILIHDSPEDIKRKIKKAYCPEKEIDNNPILEICKYILFKDDKILKISRPMKFGGDIELEDYNELQENFKSGKLHPLDLKNAVSEGLNTTLEPVRDYFIAHPKNYEELKSFRLTR